jgi:hypothetical protein
MYKMKVDKNELNRLFADLPVMTQKATAEAVNKTTRKVNKNLKTHVFMTYNIPKSAMKIGDLISITRANARSGVSHAILRIKRKARGLMKFNASQTAAGVVAIIRRGRPSFYKGGFIAPWQKGKPSDWAMTKGTGKHAGKITRVTKTGKTYEADKRMVLYGAPIANLFTNEKAETVIMKTIDDDFQDLLDVEFNKLFEKKI